MAMKSHAEQMHQTYSPDMLRVVSPHQVSTEQGLKGRGSTVFVSVVEKELADKESRTACSSLHVAQGLAKKGLRVFLLRDSSTAPFSGLDVLAGILSGFRGIATDHALLHDDVIMEFLSPSSKQLDAGTTVVVGAPADSLVASKKMLDDWDENLDIDVSFHMRCWRTAMALAQLEVLRPSKSAVRPYGFQSLSEALNLCSGSTRFELSISDLRKILSALVDYWFSENVYSEERTRLPEFARRAGFPEIPPCIDRLQPHLVARRLYEACKSLIFVEDKSVGPQKFIRATIPLSSRRVQEKSL